MSKNSGGGDINDNSDSNEINESNDIIVLQ